MHGADARERRRVYAHRRSGHVRGQHDGRRPLHLRQRRALTSDAEESRDRAQLLDERCEPQLMIVAIGPNAVAGPAIASAVLTGAQRTPSLIADPRI